MRNLAPRDENADVPIKSDVDAKAADNAVVKLTGDQTVAGTKTFSSSPVVPAPTADDHAARKKYVDDAVASGTSEHPDLAAHNTLGLATQDELDAEIQDRQDADAAHLAATNPHGIPPSPFSVPKKAGAWYAPGAATGSMSMTASRLYTQIGHATAAFVVVQLGVEVTTAVASATVRLGIFAADANGEPGALLGDLGTIDASTTGYKTTSTGSINVPAGLFFLACVQQGGASSVSIARVTSPLYMHTLSDPSFGPGLKAGLVWYENTTNTAGALPDPFPVGRGVASNANSPWIGYRVA